MSSSAKVPGPAKLLTPELLLLCAAFGIVPWGDEDKIIAKILTKSAASLVAHLLTALTYRERQIIIRRYGLGGGTPGKLKEVGPEFAVTKARVRQIEAKAIRKMQHAVEQMGKGNTPDPSEEQTSDAVIRGEWIPETEALSVRARNVLRHLGVHSWTKLQTLTMPDLLGLKNCGTTIANEIRSWAKSAGINLSQE